MNLRLENLAKWASLIALIVLIGASAFNIKIEGENKMAWYNPSTWTPVDNLQGDNAPGAGTGSGGGGGGGWADEPLISFSAPSSGAISGFQNTATAPTSTSPTYQDTGGGGLTQEQVYAQQQAAAQAAAEAKARAIAQENFNNGRNQYNTSIGDAINNTGQTFQRGIQDWTNTFNKSQQGLDTKAINANMAKTQGFNSILDMVGQGIRSGGVMLANKNAGSSSAAQAIANAYGKMGQQQNAGINNQFGQEMNQIGMDQSDLNSQKALQLSRWGEDKASIVNSIVSQAEQAITALNNMAANASITDRMDIEAEKNRVRQEAQAKLQSYDSELSNIKNAQSDEQRRSEASRLATLGTAPTQQFDYSTQMPTQWQGTGPFASELPIFTYGRNKRTA